MRRITLAFGMLIVLAPQARGAGINLSWDDCGRSGSSNRAFACQTEAGVPQLLVASVVPPAGISRFVGAEALIDIQFEGENYPAWWELANGCRAGRISASADFTSGPYSCEDFWQGRAYGGMQFYEQRPGQNRAIIKFGFAVAENQAGSLTPGREYYMFKVAILNAGTSTCPDCKRPACIHLTTIELVQPAGMGDYVLDDRQDLNVATWQGGISSPDGDLSECRADAVKNQTWGQIKNLYR